MPRWNRLWASVALSAPIPYVAQAQTYLTEEQAQQAIFPGVTLEQAFRRLDRNERKTIEKDARDRFLSDEIKRWRGPHGETLYVDRVIGKHEFITYAVGLTAAGEVKAIEIMDYRETYGHEIRRAAWRDTFKGKTVRDPVRIEKDIPNISGATLSSVHVTNGVHRLLLTHDWLHAHP